MISYCITASAACLTVQQLVARRWIHTGDTAPTAENRLVSRFEVAMRQCSGEKTSGGPRRNASGRRGHTRERRDQDHAVSQKGARNRGTKACDKSFTIVKSRDERIQGETRSAHHIVRTKRIFRHFANRDTPEQMAEEQAGED